MAAKLLYSLADDNPDLQKQIGWMSGVFQLFDRQHIVAGRHVMGHGPNRLSHGSSQLNDRAFEREASIYERPPMVERHSNKNVNDKHRVSTESSRDSFLSFSRSSSFASVEYNINRSAHHELDQNVYLETPSRDPLIRQRSAYYPQMGHQSLDLGDLVKDSMYREARGLSCRSTAKEEASDYAMNYRESLNALTKLREANWYHNEPRELPRSKSYQYEHGSSFSVSKDCPRFSYEGRETNRNNAKMTTPKHPKEQPRLSLDSRESSMWSDSVSFVPNKASDSKSNLLSRKPKSNGVISANKSLIQTRPPNVVARLMGLETLADSSSVSDKKFGKGPIRTQPVEDLNLLSKYFSRSLLQESTSPFQKNPDMKPNSRFPAELAPWKQREDARNPQKPDSRFQKSPTKKHSPVSSVYNQVDERLKHIEFSQSGKDLRALKQKLAAMQAMEKEGKQDMVERYTIAAQNERFSDHGSSQYDHINPASANRGSNASRAYESPVVIMKPAKPVERSGVGASSATHVDGLSVDNRKVFQKTKAGKDLIPKSTSRENGTNAPDMKAGGRHAKTAQNSTKQLTKESTTSSRKSSGSVSPRSQQKRIELERQSHLPTAPTDYRQPRKQSNQQESELTSPGGWKPRYSNIRQSDVQYDDISSKYREIQVSQEFNCDAEVTASECSEEFDNKSTWPVKDDESSAPEYPSPVSVLDGAVYMDDSPSFVKHTVKTLKDDTTQSPSEKLVKDQWESTEDVISKTVRSGITSTVYSEELQHVKNLVQKLKTLDSSRDEAHSDDIASLCETTKPDHRYISEILLASGLLGSSLTTFQFHSTGRPINPELFLVLERTKFSNLPNGATPEKLLRKGKLHRKLIFDSINEILERKFTARKTLNSQKLLRDLCLEIEELQVTSNRKSNGFEDEDSVLKSISWEDVLNGSESWADYDAEISVITLDVERLIFKDLVSQVVSSEASDGRHGRRCRPFSK